MDSVNRNQPDAGIKVMIGAVIRKTLDDSVEGTLSV